jgi:hypothetical protein
MIKEKLYGEDFPDIADGLSLALPEGFCVHELAIEDYFTNEQGKYIFCREDHAANCSDMLQDFVELVVNQAALLDVIIVDQPNTSVAEISPYAAVAESFGHHVVVLELNRPREVLFERNVHGVPGWVIDTQRKNLDQTRRLVSGRWKLIDASNV